MCEFKYCRGAQACFLKDSSPCPHAENLQKEKKTSVAVEAATQLGLRGKGFLDRDQLIRALGIDQSRPQPTSPNNIVRIASKLRHAAENMGRRAS